MKIAVLVKGVADTAGLPEITAGADKVVTDHLETVLNPYDEFAVEEAVRLKESRGAEVTVVSLGGEPARRALRTALAMGADSGVLVRPAEGSELTGRGVSHLLAAALRDLAPGLVLAGRQAVDDDGSQVAERVAEILSFRHASAVSRLVLEGDKVVVEGEFEGGKLAWELPLPALVTAGKGLNTPRYPTLPQVLRAKRLPILEVTPVPGNDLSPGWSVAALTIPKADRRRQIFTEPEQGVEHLAQQLADCGQAPRGEAG